MRGPLWQILEKLAALTPLTPFVFIMGGFAEEVLLGDELDRPHKDLDLLARPGTLTRLTAQLATIQPAEWEVALAHTSGQPLMLRAQASGLELEIYLARLEPSGFSIEVPAQGPAARLRLFLPADTFTYPATRLEGLAIQTVSPLALAVMRAASAQTRHVAAAGKRARDLAMLARLRATFLATYAGAQLQPRIEAV
jgi:hypothetical protein